MITFDLTITMGNVLEISTIIGGGLYALGAMKTSVGTLRSEVNKMQTEIEKIGEVVTNQAVHAQRILNLETDYRDLRRGRGFIRGHFDPGVDGEYDE